MEASCFLTSNPFSKVLDMVPASRSKLPLFHKKRLGVTCCSSKPQVPSDDSSEPLVIQSDWRSFRARLVAGEQAVVPAVPGAAVLDRAPPPAVLGDRWAHPIHEPERGCLLIATEKLDGVHIFERAVILLLSTGAAGPTGIILNRPSLMSIKETRSTAFDVAGVFSDRPLFFGGPLEEGLFLVEGGGGGEEEGEVGRSGVFEEVVKGLYYGRRESVGCAAEMVKRNMVGVGDFRFFDGYCGWEKDQLREEIRAGFWRVVACSPSVIGLASIGAIGLWDDVSGLVGERKGSNKKKGWVLFFSPPSLFSLARLRRRRGCQDSHDAKDSGDSRPSNCATPKNATSRARGCRHRSLPRTGCSAIPSTPSPARKGNPATPETIRGRFFSVVGRRRSAENCGHSSDIASADSGHAITGAGGGGRLRKTIEASSPSST